MGDFNVNVLATKKDPLRQQLIRFGNLHYLEQLIKTPTRITEKSATAIDLLFVNNYHRIIDSGVLDPSLSDHSLIYCIAKAGVPKLPPRTIEYRSYRNYSQSSFVNDLKNVDWNIIDIQENVNDAVELWEKLFTDIADRHAPTRKLRVKGRHAPWITANLSNAMRDRDYHKRKAIKSNSEYHWKLYKQAKISVNKLIKKCKSDYYIDLISKNKGDSNALWKTLNEITSRKSSAPITCIEIDGTPHTDVNSIVEGLNSHFSSIGRKLAALIKSRFGIICLDSTLSSVNDTPNLLSSGFTFENINEQFICRNLRALKTNKAIGLDRVSARLLKDSANVLAPVLTNIFNRSLASSTYPDIWKCGKVTALFKTGDRTDPNNYRPITVLPIVSKILEKAAHSQIYNYLQENKLLSSSQFGFRPKSSTEIALVNFTDSILENMDKGLITGVVSIDLTKAFDTVDHGILYTKLKVAGFADTSVDWIKSYLTHRTQITAIGNVYSTAKPVHIGVPQGSVLGPLLFIIYVNDMPLCIRHCNISLYADDTVIYHSCSDVSELEDKLNSDLTSLSRWLNVNLLTLNVTKCKSVVFGSQQKLAKVNQISLEINECQIDGEDSFKYLGVILHKNMTWLEHIDHLNTKVCQRLGVLRRVKHLLPRDARIILYNSLILPLFDYADVVWGDKNNVVLMNQIQVLQNNAARIILDLPKYASATQALDQLTWKPLMARRSFHRRVLMYKCLNGLVNLNYDFSKNAEQGYNTRGSENIRVPKVKTNWGKQRFIVQAVKDWNSVPEHVKQAKTLTSFKNFLT